MEAIEVQTRDLFGWFTEKILEVRQTRGKHEVHSQEDPMTTIYLASLLTHLISSPWLLDLDKSGHRLDIDVAERTSKSATTTRQRMEIYRAAADRYLLYLGLWDGLQGRQQNRYYQITEDNLANRAVAYYGYASDLAERLPPPSSQTAQVLHELSMNLGMYLGILLAMRGDVFHLYPTVTPGEEFHLIRG
jgi:hypothetical protein